MSMSRKSSTAAVVVVFLAAISLAVACGGDNEPEVTADCAILQADGAYLPVDDDYCDDRSHSHSTMVWIYGGSVNNGRVVGGTRTRPANTNITSRSGKAIVRGVFGGKSGSGS